MPFHVKLSGRANFKDFSKLENVLHFGHSAYCQNIYKKIVALVANYGKSIPQILPIFTPQELKFSLNILI